MNLNDIFLSPQLIVDLYHHALVEDAVRSVPQRPPVPYVGRAEKNILVVVAKPDVPNLLKEELAFLTKVLQACQLGLADVAIVNWSKAPHQDADALMEQFRAKFVILFDVKPEPFGLPTDVLLYAVATVQARQFVTAPPLHQIEKTKEAEGQLWVALKQLFCI